MNIYEELKQIFYTNIEEKCHGIYKQKAYFHSLQVCSLCKKLALEKNLDIEVAAIMGLFHDYSQFINHSSFNHALRSSEMLDKLISQTSMDKDKQVIIINAIQNHSQKEKKHDEYSEILKDADVLAQYLEEPDMIMKESYQERLKKYLPK